MRENNHHKGSWALEWLSEGEPGAHDLEARIALSPALKNRGADFTVEKIPDNVDWLKESYRSFPPFSAGLFFIHGSHYEGQIPDGQMGLTIDAATAFGSGEHGTTGGCLRAMLDLKDKGACPWNVLDMGTGSGILAIAAWKLWKSPVLAVDNDAEAVRVAARHREMNGVPGGASGLTCETGEGFDAALVKELKPFDLIIANILSRTLKEMAPAIAAASDENGYVILSGILKEQADEVSGVFAAAGFRLRGRFDVDEWSTLALQNSPS